ncbi:MAG: OprO/OprP family phosphate-selective porin [Myxococcota bacterium]
MSRGRGVVALGVAAIALALGARGASGQTATAGERAALEDRVNELEQELALVKRELEVDAETQASKGPQPVVSAGTDGFSIRSADSQYQLKIRGYTQFDGRFFQDAPANLPAGSDTFLFRRIRPIFEGTLAGVVDFRIMPDFAGSQLVVQDAYANLRYLPEAQLQFGKYKGPVGLERLQPATAMWFVERALPTQLVPNRDLGVMLQGVIQEGLVNYQLAWMNGVPDGASSADADTGNDKDLVARVFVNPFQEAGIPALQGLGIGFATTYGREEGTPGTYKTSGQQNFFQFRTGVTQTGTRARYSPQGYWYYGPFGLLTEYVLSSTEFRRTGFSDIRARNTAWQVAAGWAITGENESFKGLVPSASFDPFHRSFGALELVARFSELKVDHSVFDANFADPATQAEAAVLWTVGVNWVLNRFVKLGLNYDHTTFRNYSDNPDRHSEGVIMSEVQLSY